MKPQRAEVEVGGEKGGMGGGVRNVETGQRELSGKEEETEYSLRNKRLETSPFG